jgi:transposase
MAKHRSHSIETATGRLGLPSEEFKRQVTQEFIAGETLHGLARRHDLSRNLIRVWVRKYEKGALDDDAQAADLLQNTRPASPRWSVWSGSRRLGWSF